jgi:molybdopterin synthase catalytic subunit
MTNQVCRIAVAELPLRAPPQFDDVNAGAIVDFWGIVRKLEDGREIAGIEYEAHREMAEQQLSQIANQAAAKFELRLVLIHHRIGFIAVGEPSLFLRVATRHRSEAYRASQWIVDELKKRVPIWKRPQFNIDNAVTGVVEAGPGSPIPATKNLTTTI